VSWDQGVHRHHRYRSAAAVRPPAMAAPVRPWPACHAPMGARGGAARGSCGARDTPRCDRRRPPLPAPVGRLAPRPYGLAAVPRGLVPPPPPRRVPCRGPPGRPPRLPRGRHRTDRTPVHPAPEQALGGRVSAPLPRAGLGLGGVPSGRVVPHAPRLGRGPGLPVGLGEAPLPPRRRAPPDPGRRPQRARQPTRAPRFCRVSGGAGRGRPCGARGPVVCSRGSARRRVASRRRCSVTPGASPPSAARARGHPPGAAQRAAAREAGEAGAGHRGWGPASVRRAGAGSLAASRPPARAPAPPSSRGAAGGHHRLPAAPWAGGTPTGTRQQARGPADTAGVRDTACGGQLQACLSGPGTDRARRFPRPRDACDDSRASARPGMTAPPQGFLAHAYHGRTLCTSTAVEMH
jgi:hypothetical protein